jgi:hypothetical protein
METLTKEQTATRISAAFKLTLGLYLEAKSGLGRSKKKLDLGYSSDRIIRVCSVDYIVDVEKAIKRALKNASALESIYIKGLFAGEVNEDTWLFAKTTAEEYSAIEQVAQLKVGAEFVQCGIHPYVLYYKPTDVR